MEIVSDKWGRLASGASENHGRWTKWSGRRSSRGLKTERDEFSFSGEISNHGTFSTANADFRDNPYSVAIVWEVASPTGPALSRCGLSIVWSVEQSCELPGRHVRGLH